MNACGPSAQLRATPLQGRAPAQVASGRRGHGFKSRNTKGEVPARGGGAAGLRSGLALQQCFHRQGSCQRARQPLREIHALGPALAFVVAPHGARRIAEVDQRPDGAAPVVDQHQAGPGCGRTDPGRPGTTRRCPQSCPVRPHRSRPGLLRSGRIRRCRPRRTGAAGEEATGTRWPLPPRRQRPVLRAVAKSPPALRSATPRQSHHQSRAQTLSPEWSDVPDVCQILPRITGNSGEEVGDPLRTPLKVRRRSAEQPLPKAPSFPS
jgi:hypothetical protein